MLMSRGISIVALATIALNGLTFGEEIVVAPYLQDVTRSSVVVRWITKTDIEGVVKYGLEGTINLRATEEGTIGDGRLHEVALDGLETGRTYSYTVEVGEEQLTGKFRTAPDADQPFAFAVWGDNRTHPDTHKSVVDQMESHQIDVAINVGDIVTHGRDIEEYQREFFNPGHTLFRNVPFFVAVGNHEYSSDPKLSLFKSVLTQPGNERYFAFSYGNSRFVILDSNDKSFSSLEEGTQLDWLKREFDSEAYQDAEFHFLFLHHAPYCWDWYGGEKGIRETVVPLAERYMVDICFAGHFHCYERGMKRHDGYQTYYVVTGGGGGPFTKGWGDGAPKGKPLRFMTVHDWKYHFVLAKVDGKRLSYIAKDRDGTIMDEFTIHHKKAKEWPSPSPVHTGKMISIESNPGDYVTVNGIPNYTTVKSGVRRIWLADGDYTVGYYTLAARGLSYGAKITIENGIVTSLVDNMPNRATAWRIVNDTTVSCRGPNVSLLGRPGKSIYYGHMGGAMTGSTAGKAIIRMSEGDWRISSINSWTPRDVEMAKITIENGVVKSVDPSYSGPSTWHKQDDTTVSLREHTELQ